MTKTRKIGVTPFEARQIANIVSKRAKVTIREGEGWAYHFDDETITYRPHDLYYLTEVEVVANLLHEAGHANFSIAPRSLKYPKVKEEHKQKLKVLVNVIEDFRIEDKLRAVYPHADDYLPLYSFKTLFEMNQYRQKFIMTGKVPRLIQYFLGIYGHLAGVFTNFPDQTVGQAVEKTKEASEKARITKDTQALTDIICREMYPYIKKFLDEFPKGKLGVETILKAGVPPPPVYDDLYPSIKPLIRPTLNRLNRVLTDVKFSKLAGRYRTGKRLNKRRMYRFRLGEDKLFERISESELKDYVVALLIDESGSMRGDRIKYAIRSAILFSCVLDKMKIPFSLSGFNSKIRHYKPPNVPFTPNSARKTFQTMSQEPYGPNLEFNSDGQAIFETSKQLLPYPKKKLMFVICDGHPEPSPEGENYPLPREIVRAEKLGIQVVGIGIGYSVEVDRYYDLNLTVEEVEDLPNAIVRELKGRLR